ncbi:phosphate starvation-inducible membrane PsiE [Paraburkholderia sp. 35.1]
MRAPPRLVFMSRWLQVPLYLGLIVAQAVYVVLFLKEVWHLVTDSMKLDETHTHPKHFEGPAALHAVGGIKVSTPMKAQD